jgi:hypothetical protein
MHASKLDDVEGGHMDQDGKKDKKFDQVEVA